MPRDGGVTPEDRRLVREDVSAFLASHEKRRLGEGVGGKGHRRAAKVRARARRKLYQAVHGKPCPLSKRRAAGMIHGRTAFIFIPPKPTKLPQAAGRTIEGQSDASASWRDTFAALGIRIVDGPPDPPRSGGSKNMEVMGGNHPEMVATYSKRLNIGVLLNSTSSKRKQLTSQKVKLIKDRLIGLSIRDKSSRLVTLEPHPMPSGDNRHEGMPKSVSQDVRREMSQGVRIAFLDSGIDPSHQEFQGRKITFWDGTLQQEVSRGEMRDYGRHGTHIASVAAGTQIGRAPGAEIIMAAVLTQPANRLPGRVGSLQAIVEALIWLATDPATGLPRADIVNMSFGCADGDELAAFSEALTGLSDAGLDRLLFASAGNRYSGSLMVPAKLDVTVAVGAHTNPPDRLGRWVGSAPMSDNPPQPQLYAPGVEILGAEPGHDSQRYSAVDGTSQASAAAAGEAAYKLGLLKRAGDNSQLAAFKKGPELFLDDPTTRLVALPSVPVLQAP